MLILCWNANDTDHYGSDPTFCRFGPWILAVRPDPPARRALSPHTTEIATMPAPYPITQM
jgi:hypothetical protein